MYIIKLKRSFKKSAKNVVDMMLTGNNIFRWKEMHNNNSGKKAKPPNVNQVSDSCETAMLGTEGEGERQ